MLWCSQGPKSHVEQERKEPKNCTLSRFGRARFADSSTYANSPTVDSLGHLRFAHSFALCVERECPPGRQCLEDTDNPSKQATLQLRESRAHLHAAHRVGIGLLQKGVRVCVLVCVCVNVRRVVGWLGCGVGVFVPCVCLFRGETCDACHVWPEHVL